MKISEAKQEYQLEEMGRDALGAEGKWSVRKEWCPGRGLAEHIYYYSPPGCKYCCGTSVAATT